MSKRLEILELLKDGAITATEAERRLRELENPLTQKVTDLGKKLCVNIISSDGDRINATIPINFAKAIIGNKSGIIKNSTVSKMNIDFQEIFEMIDNGMIGELVNIGSANGDIVRIGIE